MDVDPAPIASTSSAMLPTPTDLLHDDDDIIIVDGPSDAPPAPNPVPAPSLSPTSNRPTRLRQAGRPRAAPLEPAAVSGRITRSSTHHRDANANAPKKLKLKLAGNANTTTSAYPIGTSFLGPYDRELDSSDEDLTFEEQFILRVPEEGGLAEELRKRVQTRKEIGDDVWFKFRDSRRAQFHINDSLYHAKLVDLPSILESQKTLDSKQMYKIADICQMLVVEPHAVDTTEAVQPNQSFNVDEFIYPHGVTPPLKWVRKRRFRKRLNKSTIESVENEVEKLLEKDQGALTSQYEVLEDVDPELSDSAFIDDERPGPSMPGEDEDEQEGDWGGTGQLEEEEYDAELAAELDKAFEEQSDDGDGETEPDHARGEGESESETGSEDEEGEYDEEEYSDSGDEEGDEDDEEEEDAGEGGTTDRARRRLLAEEIADLEKACEKKAADVAAAINPVIKKRLGDVLEKMRSDLEMRRAQREEIGRKREERRRARREEREEREMEEEERRKGAQAAAAVAAAATTAEGAPVGAADAPAAGPAPVPAPAAGARPAPAPAARPAVPPPAPAP